MLGKTSIRRRSSLKAKMCSVNVCLFTDTAESGVYSLVPTANAIRRVGEMLSDSLHVAINYSLH